MKKNLPPKLENVIGKAKHSISMSLYRYTAHAEVRKFDRMITEEDALHVIENGWRVQIKDSFCDINNGWKYAIEGKTLQEERLRVIVAFAEDMLIIITVINILKGD